MAKKKSTSKAARKKSAQSTAKAKHSRTSRSRTGGKKAPEGLMSDVQSLMKMMASHGVTEINIEDGERKIALRRGSLQPVAEVPTAAPAATPAAPAAAASAAPAESAPQAEPAEDLLEVKSPMVGTFYAAPSPDSDPFVSSGATVNDGTVVCIIEAMKVMNEIRAECSGTVAEVCVKNAEPVEFGQVLFRVRPN